MNERSKMISELIKGQDTRESYIRSKLSVLLPAQIRSLRLRREMKQADLGVAAGMKQGRISMLERIGEVSFCIETLIKLAAAFRVGLMVKFVPLSEMLSWENAFAPDKLDIVPLERDDAFLHPDHSETQREMSAGLYEALLGEPTKPVQVDPAQFVRTLSPWSLWENPTVSSKLSACEASSLFALKVQMGSDTMGATLSQNEQGNAA